MDRAKNRSRPLLKIKHAMTSIVDDLGALPLNQIKPTRITNLAELVESGYAVTWDNDWGERDQNVLASAPKGWVMQGWKEDFRQGEVKYRLIPRMECLIGNLELPIKRTTTLVVEHAQLGQARITVGDRDLEAALFIIWHIPYDLTVDLEPQPEGASYNPMTIDNSILGKRLAPYFLTHRSRPYAGPKP